jgi:rifampin ADP-ribosylating transferase
MKKQSQVIDENSFYHGSTAELKPGDILTAGFKSNYKPDDTMNHIYFTALPDGAGLAAELAEMLSGGERRARVYKVEPTGEYEDDPNVTNSRFPGNPTRSYRSKEPLRIVAEVTEWKKLTPEELETWRERLANIKGDIIN